MKSDNKSSQTGCCGSSAEASKSVGCCGTSAEATESVDCCSMAVEIKRAFPGIIDFIQTSAVAVPVVSAQLTREDRLGAWKARWSINRMKYSVPPGLYAVGNPTPESPVLVTANYKLSFDVLRSELSGRDVWIMVLDTNGINVWCAAGKGTFGTDEMIRRIETVNLKSIVSHNKVILPQLGAPGISAHEVLKRSGFRIVYGPVRAQDIPAFLDSDMKATQEMRRITFPMKDRAVLIPVELVAVMKYGIFTALLFVLLSGLHANGYSLHLIVSKGIINGAIFFSAAIAGTVLVPLLLPWLPGRSFSAKGFWAGALFMAVLLAISQNFAGVLNSYLDLAGWFLLVTALTSFIGMNFTGASTYTSLSGVIKEMKVAVPFQIVFAIAGFILWMVARFI
jgi:hypothetical protein